MLSIDFEFGVFKLEADTDSLVEELDDVFADEQRFPVPLKYQHAVSHKLQSEQVSLLVGHVS